MTVSSITRATLALALISGIQLRAEEIAREVLIQWSDSVRSPAVPTADQKWFIGVAPKAVEAVQGTTAMISTGGKTYTATLLHIDPDNRLCLIETTDPVAGITPTEFAEAPMPNAGSKLHCWKPGSTCPSAVTGKEYSVRGEPLSSPLLRVRVSEAEEFCEPGTPLVCENGKLFGILTESAAASDGEAHAIPACCIKKMLTEIERYGRTGKVWIGLIFENESNTPQVVEVRPDSPAALAKIEPGDVILKVRGRGVSDLDELSQSMHVLTAGDEIDVTVLRGLAEKSMKLTPKFAGPAVTAQR